MTDNTKSITIIGAGFGGLSAAALLAKEGYDVTVLEKNGKPGGRARIWEKNGFKFDMGPSWYLMPDVFERFFQEFDSSASEFFELKKLDPAYRMIFAKNDIIDVSPSLEENLNMFSKMEENGKSKLKKYLKQAEYQYNVSIDHILYENLTSITDLLKPSLIRKGLGLNVFGNLQKKVDKIFDDEKLKKILLYSIVFLGGNPANTPAIYAIMNHVDFNLGVFYPIGGIGSVVDAMVKLGELHGVKYEFNSEVTRIEVDKNIAKKVYTNLGLYESDIVVINTDYQHAETQFFDKKYQTYSQKYWNKKTIAPSAYIIYLGLDAQIPNIRHHTIVVDNNWIRHFNDIFENPSWPKFPSYYVCNPSKTDSSVAPPKTENLFILVPIAPDLEDSDTIRNEYFDKIINHFERIIGQNITDKIIVKRIFSHRDFIRDYNAFKGTALGLSHTLFQSVMFRPRHKSKKVKNVYYTGQYTHPGIGVPMVIISSTIVKDLIKKDFPLTSQLVKV